MTTPPVSTENDSDAPAPQSALQRLQSDSYSREKFFKLVGGTGAVAAFSMVLAACGADDDKKSTTKAMTSKKSTSTGSDSMAKGGDLEIVNYALTLEYIEADFYAAVVSSGLFKGAQLDMLKVIGQHEAEHVQALEATAKQLGTPADKPKTTFPLDSAESVAKLAATVENLGAAAYLGQAGRIESPDILAAALSIHSVEARHAAALNTITGQNPTPDGAFAKAMTMEEVLPLVKPFIVA